MLPPAHLPSAHRVTDGEGSLQGAQNRRVSTATRRGHGAPGLSRGADPDPEVRTCARAGRGGAQTRPHRDRDPQHATKSEIKLSAATSLLLRGRESTVRDSTGGLSAAPPRPPLPALPPGPLTAWPGLPGAAARPGRVVRALSLGRKRKRADGRGALARRLLCGDPRLRAPGVGAAGAGSARYPQPRSEEDPQRPRSGRRWGRSNQSPGINYCAGARAPARAPEPPIPPAGSRERARGAQGASRLRGSALGAVWGELRGRGGGDR